MSKVAHLYLCTHCDVKCRSKYDYERHKLTAKHRKFTFSDVLRKSEVPEFYCEKCDYRCSNNYLWEKHIKTKKHILTFSDVSSDVFGEKSRILRKDYICTNCNKKYVNYKSFWAHNKKCKDKKTDEQVTKKLDEGINELICKEVEKEEDSKGGSDYMNVINKLLIENQELRNFVIEQSNDQKNMLNKVMELSKPTNQTINNTMNNNKFNINVFLHEQCKNALNLSDFIKNIEVSHEDLENNAELGFVNGISKIFLDNLKQLSIFERPIHCTDVKRETMYIREEDKWQKDEDENKVRSAIQEVSRKSMKKLIDWKENNPDYKDMNSDFSNKCIVIHQESNAGDNREVYYPKVIKTLAKETSIKQKL